jgi:hypothetical protein
MPVPLEFLRGVLGLLCIFFAHMAGRSASAAARGRGKVSRVYAWTIRATLCAGALLFRHSLDGVAIGVYALAAVAAGVGWWDERRERRREDVSREMFH